MPVGDISALKIDDSSRSSRPSRWARWFAVVIGVLVVVTGGVFALKGRKPEVEVTTVHASSAPAGGATLLNASGYVTPRRRSTIAAKITARVEQIYAEEGMHVQQGQVLAVLDQSDVRVRLDQAIADRESIKAQQTDLEVNLANAERELARTQELTKALVSTPQALDAARTLVQSYQARIAQNKRQIEAADKRIAVSQQDIDNCTVRAPYAGIVVSKDAQRGEMVSPVSAGGGYTRTGIATLVDMNSLEVEVDVNENYIARVKTNQPVASILDAYPDWRIASHVRTIIPSADRQKATVKVRISFDQLDPKILPDMGVKVSFLDEAKPSQQQSVPKIVVPKDSVSQDNGSAVVYLFKDGAVERRAVKLGEVRGTEQEIVAGLVDGDKIVSKNAASLRDGQQVSVKE
jgi:RND family efflux transporter MFP subunit